MIQECALDTRPNAPLNQHAHGLDLSQLPATTAFPAESEAAHNRVISGLSWAGRLPLVPMLTDAVCMRPIYR